LHPVQAGSEDPIVATSTYDTATGTFTVPPRTTAVFVELEPDVFIGHGDVLRRHGRLGSASGEKAARYGKFR